LRAALFPLGKPYATPRDKLTGQLAQLLLHDNPARDRLTQGIYINDNPNDATGRIEAAFKTVLLAAPIETKLRNAQKQGLLSKGTLPGLLQEALQAGIITETEADLINQAEQARLLAISVDDFSPEQLTSG